MLPSHTHYDINFVHLGNSYAAVMQFEYNVRGLATSCVISCLLAIYDWRLSRSEDGSPECLAHNVVSLYDPHLPVQIVLVAKAKHLEIRELSPSMTHTCSVKSI